MGEFTLPDDFPRRYDDPNIHQHLASFLTARRDTASLMRAVDAALKRLGVARSIRIFQVISRSHAGDDAAVSPRFLVDCLKRDRQAIPLEELAGAGTAMTSRASVEIESEGGCRRIEPMSAEEDLFLVLDGFHRDDACRRLVKHLAELAGNLHYLHSQIERDGLTGLLNRQAFDRRLVQLGKDVGQSRRRQDDEGSGYFLGLIEIDRFAELRDRFGHVRTDNVLEVVAKHMERQFRYTDFLFRHGGEEFAAVLLHLTEAQALSAMERFRAGIESRPIPPVGMVTVSIGLCRVTDVPADTILDRAHKALYFSKSFGCNRISCYENLLAEGLLEETVLIGGSHPD
ncbi:MAG: hypothetical protein H6R26_281 [Proteobacteria bacterium]|nr:hypothetical protein [Pseudomonadota bacterium]